MMGVYRQPHDFVEKSVCHQCGEKFKKKKGERTATLKIYDSPFDQELPSTVRVHTDNDDGHGTCLEKLFDQSWGDFRYFTCSDCGRTIIRQCPSNGWHSYVRTTKEGEEICLKCYEESIVKDGIPKETFERGEVAGMFFNDGDLEKHGYSRAVHYYHVTGQNSAKQYCDMALNFINTGKKVVTEYDTMAIGGLEGYVSLWIK